MRVLSLILIVTSTYLFSQSPDWVEIVTDKAQINAKGYRVWVADVNGDEYPDLLWGGDVGAVRNHIHLMLNQQDPTSEDPTDRIFVDVSESSGIQTSRIVGNTNRIADVAALGDVDNDGDLDLVTSIYTHRSQNYTGDNDPGDRTELLLNDGNGNFTLFENSGLNELVFDNDIEPGFTNVSAICFLDYDRDGNLDIYFGTWFIDYATSGERYMPNVLVRGNGDGTFEKVEALNPAEPLYGATVFDWNNDGWVDIATSSYCRTPSKLFMNMGGEFVDATDLSNYNTQRLGGDHNQPLCQWEALPGDFDNDGDLDLLEVKVHGGYQNGEGRTTVTINGGNEEDYRLEWDLSRINRNANPNSHIGDMGGVWMDWDNDGLLDIMIGQDGYLNANPPGGVRLFFLHQNDNGIFGEITQNLGILPAMEESHSMEPADYDLDGDLDLFIASSHSGTYLEDGEVKSGKFKRIELLENKIGNKSHWIAIKPKLDDGMVYNGTRIEVYQGDEILTREIHQGGGHFGYQSPVTQYFGLGETARIDSVKIRYNGDTDKILKMDNLVANRAYLLGDGSMEQLPINYESGEGIIDIISSNNLGVIDTGITQSYEMIIRNPSNEPLSVSGIEIEGDEEISLDQTQIQDIVVSPGEQVSFNLEFTPKEREYYSAKITINTTAKNSASGKYVIEAYGEGFAAKPIATASTNELNFEPIFRENTSSSFVMVTNTGERDLTINEINFIPSDNSIESLKLIDDNISEMPIILAPNETINLELEFTPIELGNYNAALEILSDGFESNAVNIDISGVCNGPLPDPKLAGFPIVTMGQVNIGETVSEEFEIENNGEGRYVIYNFIMDENENEVFKVNEEEYPVIIDAKSAKTFEVSFTPVEEKIYFSSITFDANWESDLRVNLRGDGILTSVGELRNGEKLEFNIFPNPVIDKSTFKAIYNGRSILETKLLIVNTNGRIILESNNLRIFEGENDLNLDINSLNSGAYFLVAQTQFGNVQAKFVKK